MTVELLGKFPGYLLEVEADNATEARRKAKKRVTQGKSQATVEMFEYMGVAEEYEDKWRVSILTRSKRNK